MVIWFQEAGESGVIRVRARSLAAMTSKAQPPVLNKQTSNGEEQSKETSLLSVLTLRRETNREVEYITPHPHTHTRTLVHNPLPYAPPLFSICVQGTSRRLQFK